MERSKNSVNFALGERSLSPTDLGKIKDSVTHLLTSQEKFPLESDALQAYLDHSRSGKPLKIVMSPKDNVAANYPGTATNCHTPMPDDWKLVSDAYASLAKQFKNEGVLIELTVSPLPDQNGIQRFGSTGNDLEIPVLSCELVTDRAQVVGKFLADSSSSAIKENIVLKTGHSKIPTIAVHEFGHSAPGLRHPHDEHIFAGLIDNGPDVPHDEVHRFICQGEDGSVPGSTMAYYGVCEAHGISGQALISTDNPRMGPIDICNLQILGAPDDQRAQVLTDCRDKIYGLIVEKHGRGVAGYFMSSFISRTTERMLEQTVIRTVSNAAQRQRALFAVKCFSTLLQAMLIAQASSTGNVDEMPFLAKTIGLLTVEIGAREMFQSGAFGKTFQEMSRMFSAMQMASVVVSIFQGNIRPVVIISSSLFGSAAGNTVVAAFSMILDYLVPAAEEERELLPLTLEPDTKVLEDSDDDSSQQSPCQQITSKLGQWNTSVTDFMRHYVGSNFLTSWIYTNDARQRSANQLNELESHLENAASLLDDRKLKSA